MQNFFIILAIVLAGLLILLVSLLPRENQQFYHDSSSSVGKSGYWDRQRLTKILVLVCSLLLFVLLLAFMIVSQ